MDKMLKDTAVLDHPLQAVKIENLLRKNWSEYPGSYRVLSKLTSKQKQRVEK